MKKINTVGLVARFKPLHRGGTLMLDHILPLANEVIIGIGSSNRYDFRSPFTYKETNEMVNAYLAPRYDNYKIIPVPDFGHLPGGADGSLWCDYVKEHFRNLDYFVSANPYVANLMKNFYDVIHPSQFIPRHKWIIAKGSLVRERMAKGKNLDSLLPIEVYTYLQENDLITRFQKEFGEETLHDIARKANPLEETIDDEKSYVNLIRSK